MKNQETKQRMEDLNLITATVKVLCATNYTNPLILIPHQEYTPRIRQKHHSKPNGRCLALSRSCKEENAQAH